MQKYDKTPQFHEYSKKKPFKALSPKEKDLHLVFHHLTMDPSIENFLSKELNKNLVSLNLVIFEVPQAESIFNKLKFDLPSLLHLKLNFGCLNFNEKSLKDLKKSLGSLKNPLETFHLGVPHANLDSLEEFNEKFIKFSNIKDLRFNFFNAVRSEDVINLENFSNIIKECRNSLEKLSLNLSRNKLKGVDRLQEALLDISDAKRMNLKLILYNCNLKQKDILLICDTLLKFDNLEQVKLDIRENYNVKKEYPSSKVISYCETLICAFRQMLASGDDNELDRKYRVFY